jgi:DNA-directed RNA polymerase specialized sigma24 family protein
MLSVMMAAAAFQARRVRRTLNLSFAEFEDVEQDILLALLERRRFFDPARGPWTPFAHRIARQAAQSLADAIVADRKLYPLSLDHPANDAATFVETRADDASPSETAILDALSWLSIVRTLPLEFRLVAEAALAADGDLADAQRGVGLSTSEFYRRLREIRYRLFTIGLVNRREVMGR